MLQNCNISSEKPCSVRGERNLDSDDGQGALTLARKRPDRVKAFGHNGSGADVTQDCNPVGDKTLAKHVGLAME